MISPHSLVKLLGLRGFLAACCSALLFVAAHPPHGFWPLIFVALTPFLCSLQGCSCSQVLVRSFFLGLLIEGGGQSWIAETIFNYYQLFVSGNEASSTTAGLMAAAGFFCWMLVMASFWLLWGGLLCLGPKYCEVTQETERFSWLGRLVWPALALLVVETIYPRVFPWTTGSALGGSPLYLSVAKTTGLSLLTLPVLLVSTCLARAWLFRKVSVVRAQRLSLAAVLLVSLWAIGGAFQQKNIEEPAQVFKVGIVQPNISLFEKHYSSKPLATLTQLFKLSADLQSENPCQLIVWPEGMLEESAREELRPQIQLLSQRLGVPLVVGLGSGRRNRAYFAKPDEKEIAVYDKRELLLFGERFPDFMTVLARWGVPVPQGGLVPGINSLVVEVDGVKLGVSICYEALLDRTSRDLVEAGAQIHLNLTEDLWYGRSAAPRQHLALSSQRCAEFGLPMVRVTNGGISALVDIDGQSLHEYPLGFRGAEMVEVPIREGVAAVPVIPLWIATLLTIFACGWAGFRLMTGRTVRFQ